jgi:hypothetical protein
VRTVIRMSALEQAECGDCDGTSEAAMPLVRDRDSDWVVHAKRTNYVASQFRDLGVICLMFLSVGACIVFYFYCTQCLFGILIFSACICPYYNTMNIPLWTAIVLLTLSGWSLTAGNLVVTWKS